MNVRATNCIGTGDDRFSAYIDGRLDGEATRVLAAHLRACDACRHEHELLVATKAALRALQTPSMPPNPEFWANAYRDARLSVPEEKPRVGWLGGLALTPARRLVASMAAFAAVVLALAAPQALREAGVGQSANTLGVTAAAAEETNLNVSALVRAHTRYAAEQPLADDSRLSMVLSEEAARREAVETEHGLSTDASTSDDAFGMGILPDASVSSN